MSVFFDVYAVYNKRMKCILAWSEYHNECEVFIRQRKLNSDTCKILSSSLTKNKFEELIKLFDNRQISEYYGLMLFEEEKYMIDSYLDEATAEVQDKITSLSGYNRDRRLEKKLYDILNNCKVELSYGKKFNKIFNNLDDIRQASIKLKELDDKYKKIISV